MTSSAHPPPPGSGRTGGRGLPALLALLAAGPAWLRGGTYADWMHPWLWLAAAVLAVVLFQNRAPEHRARLLRDPVAWLGLLFITLLVLQWSNAGRALYFDADAGRWTHSQPPRPGWPFAFTAGEARQMLDWFVPAWVLVVGLRSPALGSAGVRRCWRLLAYQAGALAVFGLAQYATRTPRMYGVFPMETPFFAAFGYQNHAGSYFLLVLPLALGLLCHEGAVDGQPRRRARLFGLGLVALLALVACNLSLSRVSIVAGWAMLLPLGLLLLAFFWPRLEAAQRLNIVATGAATLCLAGLLVFGLGPGGDQARVQAGEGPEDLPAAGDRFPRIPTARRRPHLAGPPVVRRGRVGLSLPARPLPAAGGVVEGIHRQSQRAQRPGAVPGRIRGRRRRPAGRRGGGPAGGGCSIRRGLAAAGAISCAGRRIDRAAGTDRPALPLAGRPLPVAGLPGWCRARAAAGANCGACQLNVLSGNDSIPARRTHL
jgi:hypothetical protein